MWQTKYPAAKTISSSHRGCILMEFMGGLLTDKAQLARFTAQSDCHRVGAATGGPRFPVPSLPGFARKTASVQKLAQLRRVRNRKVPRTTARANWKKLGAKKPEPCFRQNCIAPGVAQVRLQMAILGVIDTQTNTIF